MGLKENVYFRVGYIMQIHIIRIRPKEFFLENLIDLSDDTRYTEI